MAKAKKEKQPTPAQVMFRALLAQHGLEVRFEYRFHPVRKWPFDYAIPRHMVAVEVEGGAHINGRHNRAQGFIADMEKYNTATSMGWRIIRVTPQDLLTTATIQYILPLCHKSAKLELQAIYRKQAEIVANMWGFDVEDLSHGFAEIGPYHIRYDILPIIIDLGVTPRVYEAWDFSGKLMNLENFAKYPKCKS